MKGERLWRNRRPKPKFRHYVEFNSGLIQRGAYCSKAQILELDLWNDCRDTVETYRFYDVPEGYFLSLYCAPSAGREFNFMIKGEFETKKFDPDGGVWRNA